MAVNDRWIQGTVGWMSELRTVGQKNTPVADARIAITNRVRDEDGNWSNGDTEWVAVTFWNRFAENFTGSFSKGDRVIIHGDVRMKPGYTDKEGNEMPASPYIVADAIGADAEWGTVTPAAKRSDSSESKSSAPAKKAAPVKKAAAKKVVEDDDDLDLDLDDDLDLPF